MTCEKSKVKVTQRNQKTLKKKIKDIFSKNSCVTMLILWISNVFNWHFIFLECFKINLPIVVLTCAVHTSEQGFLRLFTQYKDYCQPRDCWLLSPPPLVSSSSVHHQFIISSSSVHHLMINWWSTDDQLMINWWSTDDELMMNWWWTDDELHSLMRFTLNKRITLNKRKWRLDISRCHLRWDNWIIARVRRGGMIVRVRGRG